MKKSISDGVEFDSLFMEAVFAIDAGDEDKLKQLLNIHPELAIRRLVVPGKWLTSVIGDALNGFFKDPYLLWFVSEDAVRNKVLPTNIPDIASIIIQKIKHQKATSLQEQLDYTLKLVAWSWVARKCSVQIALLDVLINDGATLEGSSIDALVNGNFDAAEHLIKRGDTLSLPAALLFSMWEEADDLARTAEYDLKQFSLILSALYGRYQAIERVIGYGVDINKPSQQLYSHATALHHAVWSGSLDAVKVLINAGARVDIKDTVHESTPLDWAEYGRKENISHYLRQFQP